MDSENPETGKFTLTQAARSTSAAPTYFNGKRIDAQEKETYFYDGGVFANNPVAIGLELALIKTSLKNIRLISISTGTARSSEDSNWTSDILGLLTKSKEEIQQESYLSQWYDKTKGWFSKKGVDVLTEYKFLDDEGGDKKGVLDWMNIELLACLAMDLQKQNETMMSYYEPILNKSDGTNRYWRLDPTLKEPIDLADASQLGTLEQVAHDYINENESMLNEIANDVSVKIDIVDKMLSKIKGLVNDLSNHRVDESKKLEITQLLSTLRL